jgi:hypothetical protein
MRIHWLDWTVCWHWFFCTKVRSRKVTFLNDKAWTLTYGAERLHMIYSLMFTYLLMNERRHCKVWTCIVMYIHCYVHTLLCTYIVMHIHCYVHTLLCTYIVMYIHCYVHTLLCTYIVMYIHCYVHTLLFKRHRSVAAKGHVRPGASGVHRLERFLSVKIKLLLPKRTRLLVALYFLQRCGCNSRS